MKLEASQASIEHFIPKSLNPTLSTNYHNLFAVCKSPKIDPDTKKVHCDKQKLDKLIAGIIYLNNAEQRQNNDGQFRNHSWFKIQSNCQIAAKENLSDNDSVLAAQFIKVLNLNHSALVSRRREKISLIDTYAVNPETRQAEYKRLLNTAGEEFRQFLLIYLGQRLGYH